MDLRAGLDWCGKCRPIGIRSPDRPARRQSLYRLRYPAHIWKFNILYFFDVVFNKNKSKSSPSTLVYIGVTWLVILGRGKIDLVCYESSQGFQLERRGRLV